MDFDELIESVNRISIFKDEEIRAEALNLLFSVREYLDEDEIASIGLGLKSTAYGNHDRTNLAIIRGACNKYL